MESNNQTPPMAETAQEKRIFFAIENKRIRVLETNLAQEELGRVMRTAEELS
jgi:hypothetical protein